MRFERPQHGAIHEGQCLYRLAHALLAKLHAPFGFAG